MKTPAPETAVGRKALAAKDQALPDGTDPIPNLKYLIKAIRSIGRVDPSKRAAVKALIIKRARELGALNAKGVKGTWAFEGSNDTEAIDLAMPAKLPMVRGAADIQVTRTGPGALNVMHRSTGMKVGALASNGDGKTGWVATHAFRDEDAGRAVRVERPRRADRLPQQDGSRETATRAAGRCGRHG